MKVYRSVRKYTAFHARPDCPALRRAHEVVSYELGEGEPRVPCGMCFPDFPKLSVLHAKCERCRQTKPAPCSHNGGVMVMVPVPGRTERRRWVWPEQAYLYRLAPSSTRV